MSVREERKKGVQSILKLDEPTRTSLIAELMKNLKSGNLDIRRSERGFSISIESLEPITIGDFKEREKGEIISNIIGIFAFIINNVKNQNELNGSLFDVNDEEFKEILRLWNLGKEIGLPQEIDSRLNRFGTRLIVGSIESRITTTQSCDALERQPLKEIDLKFEIVEGDTAKPHYLKINLTELETLMNTLSRIYKDVST